MAGMGEITMGLPAGRSGSACKAAVPFPCYGYRPSCMVSVWQIDSFTDKMLPVGYPALASHSHSTAGTVEQAVFH